VGGAKISRIVPAATSEEEEGGEDVEPIKKEER
jgi:hypothetical protein